MRAGRRGPSGHEAPFLEADEPLAADDHVVQQLDVQQLARLTSSRVRAASSGLGVGSWLGWLWLTMMLGTASMTAGRKTSAFRTMAEETLPW